jgi:hypothetical protein
MSERMINRFSAPIKMGKLDYVAWRRHLLLVYLRETGSDSSMFPGDRVYFLFSLLNKLDLIPYEEI